MLGPMTRLKSQKLDSFCLDMDPSDYWCVDSKDRQVDGQVVLLLTVLPICLSTTPLARDSRFVRDVSRRISREVAFVYEIVACWSRTAIYMVILDVLLIVNTISTKDSAANSEDKTRLKYERHRCNTVLSYAAVQPSIRHAEK